MDYKLKIGNETKKIVVQRLEHGFSMEIDNRKHDVDFTWLSENQIHLNIDEQRTNVYLASTAEGKTIVVEGIPYMIQDADELNRSSKRKKAGPKGPLTITPQTPAVVISVLVKENEIVKKGQSIVVLSAMKMETTLTSP